MSAIPVRIDCSTTNDHGAEPIRGAQPAAAGLAQGARTRVAKVWKEAYPYRR